jgi:hypothetical protein
MARRSEFFISIRADRNREGRLYCAPEIEARVHDKDINGPSALIYGHMDQNTGDQLRALADKADALWAEWQEVRKAKAPAPCEVPA